MIVTLFVLGIVGGLLSGMLGLGGAVVMIPLMLSVPPLVGAGQLTMKAVAGLSMLQVLAASAAGILVHRKNNMVSIPLLLFLGIPMGAFSLVGSYLSKFMENRTVTVIFGFLVLAAIVLLLFYRTPKKQEEADACSDFSRPAAIAVGGAIGFISGVVGAGGGFILVPVMVVLFRIPIRVTVGTSLGVVFIGALMGAVGKITTAQVTFLWVLPLVLGSIPSARIGARISRSLPPLALKYLLLAVIVLSAFQVWAQILNIRL